MFLPTDLESIAKSPAVGPALITLVIGTILGGIAKHFLDEWSAKKKARRDLIAGVTKNIEDLARDYYWLLANNASTLTGLLEKYLRQRTALQLSQEPPEQLKSELENAIDNVAEQSLPYYAEFTKLTYEFNWRKGNTFFLRNYWAGKTITNLHNEIRAAFEAVEDDTILKKMNDAVRAMSDGSKDDKPASLTLADYKDLFPKRGNPYQSYRTFIANEERVRSAVQSLAAYNDLFHYELGNLYRDWFKNRFGIVRRRAPRRFLPRSLPREVRRTIVEVSERSEGQVHGIAPIGMSKALRKPLSMRTRSADRSARKSSEAKPELRDQKE